MSQKRDVAATHPLRVLHLEDSPRDAEMVRHKLDADGLACTGGQIWFDSEVGRGSTFHFTVRFGRALAGQPRAM